MYYDIDTASNKKQHNVDINNANTTNSQCHISVSHDTQSHIIVYCHMSHNYFVLIKSRVQLAKCSVPIMFRKIIKIFVAIHSSNNIRDNNSNHFRLIRVQCEKIDLIWVNKNNYYNDIA